MGYGAEDATASVDDSGRLAYLAVPYAGALTPEALVEHPTGDFGVRPDTPGTGGATTRWGWSDRETVVGLCGHRLQFGRPCRPGRIPAA